MEEVRINHVNTIRIGDIDYPELIATPSTNGRTWKIWCEHCRRWHTHSPEPGHAVAHCINPDSPYQKTGYFLRLA